MIFDYALTVPANTAKASPATQVMKLTRGIIHKLEIVPQGGPRHQVSVTIHRALHQVWPTNPDGEFKVDWFPISGPVWYELEDSPYQLEAYGWSPGTTYAHTIFIRIWIQRRDVLLPHTKEMGLVARIGEFLGLRR